MQPTKTSDGDWLDEVLSAGHDCDEGVLERAVHCVHEGLIIECGVFRGKSLRRICAATDQTVYGFDSFAGLPEEWRPQYPKGALACEPPSGSMLPHNAKLIHGEIATTLPNFLRKHRQWIGFIHLDVDVYSSTRDALAAIEMRLCSGSILLFDEICDTRGDDCNSRHEKRAFLEFIERTGYRFEYFGRRHAEAFAFVMT